jgi:multiple sugar transport system permease protein
MLARANWLGEFLKHGVLLAGAIVVLLPFYLMLSYSLKSPHEIQANVGGFVGSQEIMTDQRCVKAGNPEEECQMRPIVYNYTAAFKEAPLVRYMLNGVFITVSIFIIQVIVALPCAYALSKLRFWGRDVVFGLVIFCLLIPVHCSAALYHAC